MPPRLTFAAGRPSGLGRPGTVKGGGGKFVNVVREKKLKIMLSKVDYLIGSIYMFGMIDAG